jgi:hypothetical protein
MAESIKYKLLLQLHQLLLKTPLELTTPDSMGLPTSNHTGMVRLVIGLPGPDLRIHERES